MPLETADRYQNAVLRQKTGVNAVGQPTLGTAAKVKVRWEDKLTETLDAQGNVVTAAAVVVVDREVTVGSIIWKGTTTSPTDGTTQLYEVISYSEVPDVLNREVRRQVLLNKYSMKMPPTT